MTNQSRIEFILTAVDKGLTAGFNRAIGSIRSFVSNARQAESGVRGLTTSVTGLVAPLLGAVSAAAGMQKLVTVSREFDKISAGLITATGSAENSEQAFAAIQNFATKTPYDLQQVSEAFVKLVNMGLDPSERALTSYGNTSASLGKDLNQMIEAVADAATGEFERLKEFGIKARSEGDQVSFTFRGVTTTVGKNAKEIEDYLIKLGETNFGDAMANQMAKLDGEISNLGDEWDKVFLNISKAGIGELIAKGVRVGIGALEELNAMITSGELEGYLRAQVGRWSGWAGDIKKSLDIVGNFFSNTVNKIEIDGKGAVDFVIESFRQIPENIRAYVGLMVVTWASGFDKVKAYATAFRDGVAAIFTDDTVGGARERLNAQLKIIDGARDASIDAILAERQAAIASSEAQIEAAKKLRQEYDARQAAAKADSSDKLAQYRVATEGSEKSADALKKEAAERKKVTADLKKQQQAAAKLTAEKLRAASRERILALELERLESSKLPTALQRAEAELAIDRKVMLERVALKRQELDALKGMEGVDPAEIIKGESELSELRLDVSRTELDGQRAIATERLAMIEDSWRQSSAGVALYRQAVSEAFQLGLMETEDYNERMIASGDDMGAAMRLGFQKAMEGMRTDAEMMISIASEIPDRMASGLANIFSEATKGVDSAKEAVADWARSTISWISQIILKQMILNALQNMGFGAVGGGAGLAMAGGGQVPGWSPSPTADNIPVWMTAREFVHPVRAVDYYGLNFMESIRRLQFPRNLAHALAGGTLPRVPSSYRLAAGGQVPGQAPATNLKSGDTRLKVINVIDKNMVGDYLRTADGETAIINMIRRNGSAIKTILG